MGEVRVLAAERVYVGVIAGCGLLAAVAAGAVIFREAVLQYPILMITLYGISLLILSLGQRRCRVELDDDGVHVTGVLLGRERHFRWEDLLEVGFSDPHANWAIRMAATFTPGLTTAGCVVLVRPKGGRFDVPGPNAPTQIAVLPIFGAARTLEAKSLLRDECARRGLPFSERGLRMLDDAPPGSPLRGS